MVGIKMGVKTAQQSVWHLIAGALMIILGVYIWFNPLVSLVALAMYLGAVFIIVGLGYAIISFSYESGWYMLVGALDILVGVVLVSNLGVTAETLPIIFALWCMAVGVAQIVAAYQLHRGGGQWSWSLLAGVLGVVFGFWILAYPVLGSVVLAAMMGTYVLLFGVIEVWEYVQNRRLVVKV